MEDKNKLRDIIFSTRKNKNIARDKISELLKIKGIEYAESSLQRYETGTTEAIRAEVLKGLCEILGLDTIEMYKLAGFIDNDIDINRLTSREKIHLNNNIQLMLEF